MGVRPWEKRGYGELIDGLFDAGCVKFGNFTLASGMQSPVYLDLRRLVSFPSVLDLAVEAYVDVLLKLQYDYIAGVPYAALPIASIAASKLKQPMVYSRKELKPMEQVSRWKVCLSLARGQCWWKMCSPAVEAC